MSIEERIRLLSYSTFTNTFSLHTRETTCDEDKTCTETSVSVHARVEGDSLGRRARVRRPEVSVHVWPSFDNRHACTETGGLRTRARVRSHVLLKTYTSDNRDSG